MLHLFTKRTRSWVLFFTATSSLACPLALPSSDPLFCQSFQTAAQCHCTTSGLPQRMCQDMNVIYERMIAVFRSVKKACEYQHDTSTQNCIDAWHCYREGGINSDGERCSATGRACV